MGGGVIYLKFELFVKAIKRLDNVLTVVVIVTLVLRIKSLQSEITNMLICNYMI
jgi:hypothetical protein